MRLTPRSSLLAAIALLAAIVAPVAQAEAKPGALDRSFGGGDGVFTTDVLGSGTVVMIPAMAVAPDGTIGLAGTTWPAPGDVITYRVKPDGSSGQIVGTVPGFEVRDIAFQADGKLLVAGSSGGQFAVARLRVDGQLDDSYAGDGIHESVAGTAYEIAVEPSGSAIVVGREGSDTIRVERIALGGSPAGVHAAALGESAELFQVAVRPDGGIIAAGYRDRAATPLLMGLTPGLTPNPGFSPDVDQLGPIADINIQSDGRILVAAKLPGDASGSERIQILLRLLPDGSRDPSFESFKAEVIRGVVPGPLTTDPAGRIVFVGSFLGRVLSNGSLDPTFASGGLSKSPTGGTDVALQPDGRILILGSQSAIPASLRITRFLGGSLRCGGRKLTRFGTDGADTIRGTKKRDVIAALGGGDLVRGLRGPDIVCGGGGHDRLFGGPGRDRLVGGGGNDVCRGGRGRDAQQSC